VLRRVRRKKSALGWKVSPSQDHETDRHRMFEPIRE
jgi:hypothetical protein